MIRLQHHDVRGFRCTGPATELLAGHAQFGAQIHQRQQVATQTIDRHTVDHLNRRTQVLGLDAHQLEQRHLRDRIAIAATVHQQGRDDRQGQRNLDAEGGALAAHGGDIHGAADLLDVGLDHIHAHAAA